MLRDWIFLQYDTDARYRTIYIYLFSVPQSFSLDIENASAIAAIILEDISCTNILIISRSYNILHRCLNFGLSKFKSKIIGSFQNFC